MSKLIQDITPFSKQPFDTVQEQPVVKRLSTDTLMNELFERGVSIQTIFGRFYELEAIGDARSDEAERLTVGDALLVTSDLPKDKAPF